MLLFVLLVAVCGNALVVAQQHQQQQQQNYDNSYQRGQYQQQQQQPQAPLSAIVMHKQALGQDGSFNYAFSADNGLQQGESISPDGSRTGSYSYVDPNGKTISVKYTAGKDGFKILEGDHIPKAPQPQAQPQPQQGSNYYQQPQYQQPQYQQQGAALYHRAQPVRQAYQPQATHGGSPARDAFSGYGSESRFSGIRDEINSISSQGNFNPAQVYRVHENHGESPAQPRFPTLFEQEQGGPVTYPPPPQQQRSAVPKYFRAAKTSNQQQSEDAPEEQGPHTFGNGYSFEFAG